MATQKEILARLERKFDELADRVDLIESNHLHTIEEKINGIQNRLWLICGILATLMTGLQGVVP